MNENETSANETSGHICININYIIFSVPRLNLNPILEWQHLRRLLTAAEAAATPNSIKIS